LLDTHSTLVSQQPHAPEKIIAQTLVAQIDSLTVCKNKLLAAVEGGKADANTIAAAFFTTKAGL
jgi:hypothetical protein